MRSSAKAFLARLLDYAGMFPPANLALDTALVNYLTYRRAAPYAWMLGRFVCPATRLGALARLPSWVQEAVRPGITALGQSSPDLTGWLARLDADLQFIQDFECSAGSGVVEMLELTLPTEANPEVLAETLPAIQARLQRAQLCCFLEIPRQPSWRSAVTLLSQALAEGKGHGANPSLGLKLRCGGTAAAAFPSDEDVAFFIVRCGRARVPWKATAGLHHPFRTWDGPMQLWHHGFLNVFAAGLLAFIHPLAEADVAAILADREGQPFHFDDGGLAWKHLRCSTEQIAELRKCWLPSFGTCSFTEPCQELHDLGLIEPGIFAS